MEWHLIELPKLPEETDGTPLDKWTHFINAEKREEFEMIVQGNEYLQSAFENYERVKNEMKSELIAKWKAKCMTDEQIKELLN